MTNKEIRKLSKEQLNGNRLYFAILTLIFLCVGGLEYFLLNGTKFKNISELIINSIIVVLITSIYLNKSRTNKINIKNLFKNWKVYLRTIVLTFIIIMILYLIIYVILNCFTAPFIFENKPSDFVVKILLNSNFIIMLILIFLTFLLVKINFMPAVYLLVDGRNLKESISESFKLMKGNKCRLIKLILSFLWWFLLVIITIGIAGLWVIPYYQMTLTNFYRDIKGEFADKVEVIEIIKE